MVELEAAPAPPALLGPGWGLLTWGGPHLRDALLKAPDPTGFSRLVSLSAVECMPDRYGSGSGFRNPHDDLRSQRREIFRFWSTKNRVFWA